MVKSPIPTRRKVIFVTGISYLSRAQESAARVQIGNPKHITHMVKSSSNPTVADSVFIERIKLRVKHWRQSCKDSSTKSDGKVCKHNAAVLIISESSNSYQFSFLHFTCNADDLVRCLRKVVLGSEEYGSRPCMNIDVCSERQVELVLVVR